jgi:hypothetical protein
MIVTKFVKIVLKFEENFWGEKTFIGFLSENYPMALNIDAMELMGGTNILMFYVSGPASEVVEQQDPE